MEESDPFLSVTTFRILYYDAVYASVVIPLDGAVRVVPIGEMVLAHNVSFTDPVKMTLCEDGLPRILMMVREQYRYDHMRGLMRFSQCKVMIYKFLCKNLYLRQPHALFVAASVNKFPRYKATSTFHSNVGPYL